MCVAGDGRWRERESCYICVTDIDRADKLKHTLTKVNVLTARTTVLVFVFKIIYKQGQAGVGRPDKEHLYSLLLRELSTSAGLVATWKVGHIVTHGKKLLRKLA